MLTREMCVLELATFLHTMMSSNTSLFTLMSIMNHTKLCILYYFDAFFIGMKVCKFNILANRDAFNCFT